MSDKKTGDERSERLAAQLRANLARRKAQARAKRAGGPDRRPDGMAAGSDGGRETAPGGPGKDGKS